MAKKVNEPLTADINASLPGLPRLPDHPLVTVVVSNYNHGEFIEETILSLLNQDYDAIELIVADGASTDNSLAIFKRYETDPRFRWISEPDVGPIDALIKGLRISTGDLVGTTSSTDPLLPGAIRTMVKEFTADLKLTFVGGWLQGIDVRGKPNGIERFLRHERSYITVDEVVRNDRLPFPVSDLIRRDLALETAPPHSEAGGDEISWYTQYMLETLRRGGHLLAIPKLLATTRKHPNNRSERIGLVARVARTAGLKRVALLYKDFLTHRQVRILLRRGILWEIGCRKDELHQTWPLIPLLWDYALAGGWPNILGFVLTYLPKKVRGLK